MKRPKKPTLAQKKLMGKNRLVPDNWMVVKETPEELVLISKSSMEKGSRKTKSIRKENR